MVELLLSEKYFPVACAFAGVILGAVIPTSANIFMSIRAQRKETRRKILEMAYNASMLDINLKLRHLDSLGLSAEIPPLDSFMFHFIQSIDILMEKRECSPEQQACAICDIEDKTNKFLTEYQKIQKERNHNANINPKEGTE